MIDLLAGELGKARRWRLLFGLLGAVAVAMTILSWRYHVSVGVMHDLVDDLPAQLESLRESGAPPEVLDGYRQEFARYETGYLHALRGTSAVGSASVVFGWMASAPGALAGLVLGAGSMGLEMSTGFLRTTILSGVSRLRIVAAKASGWALLSVTVIASATIVGLIANAAFQWLYDRPLEAGRLDFGLFLAGATGAALNVLVWAALAGFAAYLVRSTLGGLLLGGGYLLLDAVIAQNSAPFANVLLTGNVWRIAQIAGDTPMDAASLAPHRVWFENYAHHTLSGLPAAGAILIFLVGTITLLSIVLRHDDITL